MADNGTGIQQMLETEVDVPSIKEAKLWLDNGKMFGSSDKGFQRINIALPKEKL